MRRFLLAAACASVLAASAETAITDAASATAAAKRYTKARCAGETSCTFKPEREGKQWRVWVKMSRREGSRTVGAGSLVLYFDTQGNLLRRLEAD